MPRVLQPDNLGTIFRDIFKRLAQLERGTPVIALDVITPSPLGNSIGHLIPKPSGSPGVPSAPFDPTASMYWYDDFLGLALSEQYDTNNSGSGTAVISANPSLSGLLSLACPSSGTGRARVRLGEEPSGGAADVRNWNTGNNCRSVVRAQFNSATYMEGTIGFIGTNDPNNVAALIFNETSGGTATWLLQCVNNETPGAPNTVDTGFTHTPGTWFTADIRCTPSAVTAYINGSLAATYSTVAHIPTLNLAHEFQLWNKPSGGGNSNISAYFDFLYLTQNR